MTAGLASAIIDPETSIECEPIGGASEAAVGHRACDGQVRDVGLQKLARCGHKSGEFGVGERLDKAERMDVRGEADFGFEDVSDAGEQGLRHECGADFEFRTGAQAGNGFGSIELRRKERRAERSEASTALQGGGSVELGDLYIEGDSEDALGVQDDAHMDASALPAFSGAVDVPTAAHEHVRQEGEIARKMDEQPLPAGFDVIDGPTGDRRINLDTGQM